jgi:hypothetical protein
MPERSWLSSRWRFGAPGRRNNMNTLRYYARDYAREPATGIAEAENEPARATEATPRSMPVFMPPSNESPCRRGARIPKENAPGGRVSARTEP